VSIGFAEFGSSKISPCPPFCRSFAFLAITSTGDANPQPFLNSGKPAIDTEEELAKLAKVSHDTIWKVKKIEEGASEERISI